jgi:AcrR family transcriptional regulator
MTDPTATAPPGLRERKRLATRRAIQVAVLDLIAENGFDAVTVEMISRRADVSPRTFFNYFTSKEEAVVGDPPELPDGAAIDHFVDGHDEPILDGLVALLDQAVVTATVDRELVQRRRIVLRAHPDLFAKRIASMRDFEERLSEIVARRFTADPRLSAAVSDGGGRALLESRAHLVTLVVIAALRHAWAEWIDDDDADHAADHRFSLRARMEDSFADLRRVVTREL